MPASISQRGKHLVLALLCLIMAGGTGIQAYSLLAEHERLQHALTQHVSTVAANITTQFGPLVQLSAFGVFAPNAQPNELVTLALERLENSSLYLRNFQIYSEEGTLVSPLSEQYALSRPDLPQIVEVSTAAVRLQRAAHDADRVEAVATVPLTAATNPRWIVVAEGALAPPSPTFPGSFSWTVVTRSGEAIGMPVGLPQPADPLPQPSWTYRLLRDQLPVRLHAPRSYRFPIAGTDATLRGDILLPPVAWVALALGVLGSVLLLIGLMLGKHVLFRNVHTAEDVRRGKDINKDLGHVLASIARDARTPLNSIYGFAHLLTETELLPEQAEWASRIVTSAQSLTFLLDSLVELGDRPVEDIDIQTVTVRPDLLLREATAMFESAAFDRGLDIRTKIHRTLFEYVELDEKKVKRVLYHVLHNAVKYTEQGGVYVCGHLDSSADGSKTLVVSVEDTGPGVSPEDRERIFEKFRRGGGRPISSDGLGIGLYVARLLARRLGGDVTYQDRPEGGSVFTITLPTRETAILPTASALRGKTALLIGFEATRRTKLAADIHRLGLITETAPDGFLGLGMAERILVTKGALDIVFLDDGLTNMLPEVFLHRFRNIRPFEEIPVILVLRHDKESLTNTSDFSAIMRDDINLLELEKTLLNIFQISDNNRQAVRHTARVLVIEDNHVNRTLLTEILRRAGHSVFSAADGLTALNILEKTSVDLIILDIALPGISGVEVAKKLKSNSKTSHIPIIVVTAHEDADTLDSIRRAGVSNVLLKPVDSHKLVQAIDYVLRQERMTIPDNAGSFVEDEHIINPTFVEALYLDSGPGQARAALELFISTGSRDLPRVTELVHSGMVPRDITPLRRLREDAENLGAVQLEGELQCLLDALDQGDLATAERHAAMLARLWEPTRVALLRTLTRCEQRYRRST